MTLKPILTEKSLKAAGEGKYSFLVDMNLTKFQAKELIGKTFKVDVKTIKVVKTGGEIRKTFTRVKRSINPTKKVVVSLGEKQKIDLFESDKKKKK
jgi:ribosomal protein L23